MSAKGKLDELLSESDRRLQFRPTTNVDALRKRLRLVSELLAQVDQSVGEPSLFYCVDKTVQHCQIPPAGLVVGRDPQVDLVLEFPGISRRHFAVECDDEGSYWIKDLGSHNGVMLNDRRLHGRALLHSGDIITVTDKHLAFVGEG